MFIFFIFNINNNNKTSYAVPSTIFSHLLFQIIIILTHTNLF